MYDAVQRFALEVYPTGVRTDETLDGILPVDESMSGDVRQGHRNRLIAIPT